MEKIFYLGSIIPFKNSVQFNSLSGYILKYVHFFLTIGLNMIISSKSAATEQFWWGVSTSPYQTEDVAIDRENKFYFKTDWDIFYDIGKLKYPKKNGVFSYTEYQRDIEKIKELGVSHYRFGIEWARIEPSPGVYNIKALEHYKKIVTELKKNHITPIICLWHWTFPSWGYPIDNSNSYGWMNAKIKERWPEFVKLIVNAFVEDVEYIAPQNEPNAQGLAGFFLGIFPPGEKHSLSLYRTYIDEASKAFIVSSKIIKELAPKIKVISIQNMIHWKKTWWDIFGYFYDLGNEFNFKHLDLIQDHIDILGFNYYYSLNASPFNNPRIIDPNGLENIIRSLASKYNKPLLITENGWPDGLGKIKNDYFAAHIKVINKMRSEVNLIGYFYWSLVDNFEWSSGYQEKYGLYSYSEKDNSLKPYEVATSFKKVILEDRNK